MQVLRNKLVVQTGIDVWGYNATGVRLSDFGDGSLQFIGCPGGSRRLFAPRQDAAHARDPELVVCHAPPCLPLFEATRHRSLVALVVPRLLPHRSDRRRSETDVSLGGRATDDPRLRAILTPPEKDRRVAQMRMPQTRVRNKAYQESAAFTEIRFCRAYTLNIPGPCTLQGSSPVLLLTF